MGCESLFRFRKFNEGHFMLRYTFHHALYNIDYVLILATIIDHYWLTTSKKCCLDKKSFRVIFDDENKSQWIFQGKKKQKSCLRKNFCPKMHPRNDQVFFVLKYKNFNYLKDIDICLLELSEDVIETGRVNNIPLRTICLPEKETLPGSSCFTSGINRDSKIIDAVPLNLFNHTFCDDHSTYNIFGTTLNENQLCAGIPSNTNFIAPFNGKYEQDFGGPLICLDPTSKQPIFTGVASTNSLSTIIGEPGLIRTLP